MAFLIYFGAAVFLGGGALMASAFMAPSSSGNAFLAKVTVGLLAVLLGLTLFIVGSVLYRRDA